MNTTITIIQGVTATLFFLSGSLIFLFKNKLSNKLSWLSEYSPRMVLFICASKIIGALGLVLPMYFDFFPILTPFAALGLASIMILAMAYHLRKKEYKDVPATIIFLVLTSIIAFYRFSSFI